MSIQSVRTVIELTPSDPTRRGAMLRLVEGEHARNEARHDWLGLLLAPFGVKRRIGAQTCLFSVGDKATNYYLVESGQLLLHRHPRHGDPAIRLAEHGALLIFDCDGSHVADCHATRDSVVLAIDRLRFETQAELDTALKGVLNRVHADELGMILESLGVECPRQPIEARAVPASFPARLMSRGRWRPCVAHRSRTV